jgi:ribosome-binding factor A
MKTRRTQRVAQAMKQAISQVVLFELSDPRMAFCTITDVDVSPDMKVADVNVSVAGDEKAQKLCFEAIQHARGYIQKAVAPVLKSKYCPTLKFHLDESVKGSVEISRLIEKARAEDREARGDEISETEES